MVMDAEVKAKELPIIDANYIAAPAEGESGCGSHSINFDRDSWVVVFTGRRGGGKTTAMTWVVARSVALYNCKVIANYSIEFMLRRHRRDGKSYLQHVKNELFDFEKLICEPEKYRNCLIVLDEAPDIISHMASQSYKNRLVAAFVRQLRKNYNTLLMGAQSESWIDKSMRWQIDLNIDCRDVSRILGDDTLLERGECLELTWYDESGQWTGKSTEERIRDMNRGNDEQLYVMKTNLFPRIMFGDDAHKAVFDSWLQIDILDNLRKVDLRLSALKIGDKHDSTTDERYPVSARVLQSALESIELVLSEHSDESAVYQAPFYDSLGLLGDADKNNLGKLLSQFNVERGRDSSNGKRWLGLSSFDIDGFRAHVEKKLEIVAEKT